MPFSMMGAALPYDRSISDIINAFEHNGPRMLMRIAPLVTSACSLWYSFDQDLLMGVVLNPNRRAQSNSLLPSSFRSFFRSGLVRVVGLLGLTLLSGGYNAFIDKPGHETLYWYTTGTLLAASQLIFVPFAAPKVYAIIENGSQGVPNSGLDSWLMVHRVRTWVVDLAAWGCFVAAAVM
ncbi:putative Integral membrane protein [Trichophyton interdigitale]|uniref:Integral membrane protein n=1 Tax=Trichophyton interdigitale TaxID=101480 RepID=A0A9P4YIC9_9EURO|nr:putative Integral membrane protein [Trichophyton interdigitale]KAF3898632.1 putative Integral membrane protein [Trichophyton interdigitale]KAG8210243.1 putative Integral membrane protein [Trichophyton interdigitale]